MLGLTTSKGAIVCVLLKVSYVLMEREPSCEFIDYILFLSILRCKLESIAAGSKFTIQ